jgi:hypothetical protein
MIARSRPSPDSAFCRWLPINEFKLHLGEGEPPLRSAIPAALRLTIRFIRTSAAENVSSEPPPQSRAVRKSSSMSDHSFNQNASWALVRLLLMPQTKFRVRQELKHRRPWRLGQSGHLKRDDLHTGELRKDVSRGSLGWRISERTQVSSKTLTTSLAAEEHRRGSGPSLRNRGLRS